MGQTLPNIWAKRRENQPAMEQPCQGYAVRERREGISAFLNQSKGVWARRGFSPIFIRKFAEMNKKNELHGSIPDTQRN